MPNGYNRVCFDYSEGRDGTKLAPLNDYLRFLGRVYAEACRHVFATLSEHFGTSAWNSLEPLTRQDFGNLCSNLMAASVGCGIVVNEIAIGRIELAEDERCGALGKFLNCQNRSLAAMTWTYWARAQNAAFRRFLALRLCAAFRGRRFGSDTVGRLVSAAFDCSFGFGNEAEAFHLVLRAVIAGSVPEAAQQATTGKGTSFVMRFTSRRHRVEAVSAVAADARRRLDEVVVQNVASLAVTNSVRGRLVDRLGAFYAFIVGTALKRQHKLVGSGPLALLGPVRVGAPAPYVGDVDLAVEFSANESTDARRDRRAQLADLWGDIIKPVLAEVNKDQSSKVQLKIRFAETCMHFDVSGFFFFKLTVSPVQV